MFSQGLITLSLQQQFNKIFLKKKNYFVHYAKESIVIRNAWQTCHLAEIPLLYSTGD